MTKAHRQDHELIAEAIEKDWLSDYRLLVHLAREHGLRVDQVENWGLVPLIVMHDACHGNVPVFADAERRSVNDRLHSSLTAHRKMVATE